MNIPAPDFPKAASGLGPVFSRLAPENAPFDR
jgi:hypothetical protein